MTVNELVQVLKDYPPDAEVRIVDRESGFDTSIMMVENETYGLDVETQVGIFVS